MNNENNSAIYTIALVSAAPFAIGILWMLYIALPAIAIALFVLASFAGVIASFVAVINQESESAFELASEVQEVSFADLMPRFAPTIEVCGEIVCASIIEDVFALIDERRATVRDTASKSRRRYIAKAFAA